MEEKDASQTALAKKSEGVSGKFALLDNLKRSMSYQCGVDKEHFHKIFKIMKRIITIQ